MEDSDIDGSSETILIGQTDRLVVLGSGVLPPRLLRSQEVWRPAVAGPRLETDDSSFLPGVPEERRFHNFNPEIVMPNGILRRCLREDFRTARGEATNSLGLDGECQLQIGFARSQKFRLHEAILVVTNADPTVVHAALLERRKVCFTTKFDGSSLGAYHVRTSSMNHYMFSTSIVSIHACHGKSTPYFAIMTEYRIHFVALHYTGHKQDALVHIEQVFEISLGSLNGQRPVSCVYNFTDQLRVLVLASDGVLRVWAAGTISNNSRPHRHLQVTFSSRLPQLNSFPKAVHSCSEDCSALFILYKDRVMLGNTASKRLVAVYVTQTNEAILSVEVVPRQNDGLLADRLFCILTSQRVILCQMWDSAFRVRATWKHSVASANRLTLQVVARATLVTILLLCVPSGLCTMYEYNFSRSVARYDACRIDFGPTQIPRRVLPYICNVDNQINAHPIFGVLYIDGHTSLRHNLFSRDADVVCQLNSLRGPIAPALISENVVPSRDLGEQVLNASPSCLDMTRAYSMVVTSRPSHRARLIDQSAGRAALFLAYELMYVDCSVNNDFDHTFEAGVLNLQGQGNRIEVTPGLRLHNNSFTSSEPDSYTAFELEQMLAPWLGTGSFSRGILTSHLHKDTRARHQEVARSLSMSTVVIKESSPDETPLVELCNLCRPIPRNAVSGSFEQILREWTDEGDPLDYVWHNLRASAVPPITQSFAVQDIPAFRKSAPPVVSSSQVTRPVVTTRPEQPVLSSQPETQFPATQPVQGKFADRKQKRRKRAGF